jgi:amino-acid N-acetyltransferase
MDIGLKLRKARVSDVKEIHALVNALARSRQMLPRSLNDLYENLRDIFVYEKGGEIGGTCSLHILWDNLAEIRSLAVKKDDRGAGIGTALVKKCMEEAKALGISRVFALTYNPDFFSKFGFREIDKSYLPQKIWGECIKCPHFPDCDEYAVIKELKRAKP